MKKLIVVLVIVAAGYFGYRSMFHSVSPCEIVTQAEVDEAYGVTTSEPQRKDTFYWVGVGDTCSYRTNVSSPQIIEIAVVNSCKADPGFTNSMAMGKPTPIEGLGDDAAVSGPIVMVRKGDRCLVFSAVAGLDEWASARAANKSLASKALERLPK